MHSVLPDILEQVAIGQIRQLHHRGCLPRRDTHYHNVYLRIEERRFHTRRINLEGR